MSQYVPALRYRWLTHLYDPVVRTLTREETFKHALVEQAHIAAGQKILDLGCGTGTLALMVKRRHPTAEVFGIDGDPMILELARKKTNSAGVDVHFDLGLATSLPYSDASFDRVLSSLLFHHLLRDDKLTALREVHRVLKPGAELHIADWGKPRNRIMRALFLGVQALDGFRTTQDSVEGLLPCLMADAGFSDVKVTRSYATITGTLSLCCARKRAS